jgi:RNA polymerase sigma-70 factor (ECF subfamily)
MHPLSESMAEACPSREPAQEAALEQHDAADRIYKLLATLPENQQEVVRLKFQNGLSYKEISGITKLSVTYVGYLLHTALRTLREELK